jgi:hypothetical protein
MSTETLELERLVDDPEIRRAAAKTLKGFCLTYLPHHFPADLSDFFDDMAGALQDYDTKRLEVIGFRGSAKSTMASLALLCGQRQKIRGVKHRQHRPSLIIADDVEDLDWVRSQENRDKSDRRYHSNVAPSLDEHDGRMVIIGNWLHTDGLMARLKNTGILPVLGFPLPRDGAGTEVERRT